MYCDVGFPTLIDCTFSKNSGGGISAWESELTLINCKFIKNSAADYGAGIYSDDTDITLANCTFSGNSAGKSGGGIFNNDDSILTNCILWSDIPNEITEVSQDYTRIVTYSDVQGGWHGEGNIDADPLFADPNNNDYHLKSQAGCWDVNEGRWTKDDMTSPCIDTGDPHSPIGLEPFPNGGIINMGAYGGTAEASKSYFGEPVCETIVAGDINGDCIVNLKDFALMASHWLEKQE